MNMKKDEWIWVLLRNIILFCGFILIIGPLFMVLINSLKTLEEAGNNFFALPSSFYLGNYQNLFSRNNYWVFVRNSLVISVTSVLFLILFVPSLSYSIARNMNKKRYYRFIYYYFLMGLFIPSQVIMLPVTKLMTQLGLLNQRGLILLYASFSLTKGSFLFVNYIRSIPTEIEEAARVDGCSVFQIYTRITLHLIKPMLATLVVLDLLWYWNDFMLPLMILNKNPGQWTLPLFQYNFKTEYSFDYTMSFTAYLMSMLPMLLVYALGQKHIVKGLTAGAVKG